MFKYNFKKINKKAESGVISTLLLQAILEIVMAVTIFLIFFSYGNQIIKDSRIYQIYYSKDMSLLINTMIATPGDFYFNYTASPGYKFHNLSYAFFPYYVSVYPGTRPEEKKRTAEISYIHFENFYTSRNFENSLISNRKETIFDAPTSIYFIKKGNDLIISSDLSLSSFDLTLNSDCKDFDNSEFKEHSASYFYFIYNDDIEEIKKHFSSRINNPQLIGKKYLFYDSSVKSSLPRDLSKKIYFEFEKKNQLNDYILIYVPFDEQKGFACKLRENLEKNLILLNSGRYSVKIIPTQAKLYNEYIQNVNIAVKISAPEHLIYQSLNIIIDFINQAEK